MRYTWKLSQSAEKQFGKLDRPIQKRIYKWLETNIENCENPRLFGKALEGNLENYWRYQIGKYRIIANIQDHLFTVLVVKTGKREDIYKSHK